MSMTRKRLISILLCILLIVTVMEMSVFALGPDSEWTVAQQYPEAPEVGQSIPTLEASEPAAMEPRQTEDADAGQNSTPTVGAAETEAPASGETQSPDGGETQAPGDAPAAQEDNAGDAPQAVPVEEILIVGGETLAVGESLPLSAVVLPEEATNKQVRWSAANGAAAVSEDGVVTALASGRTEIRAIALDGSGVEGAHALTIYMPPAEEIANVPASLTLGVGQAETIRWAVLPAHASQEVTFTTSNKKIATVTADGKVKGLKAGVCTVTLETPNGKRQSCRVEVVKAPAAMALNATTVSLGIDAGANLYETFTLKPRIADGTATSFSFRSNRESVATVSESGLITAKSAGEATITVTTHNSLQATCKVLVRSAPQKVSITGVLALSAGDTRQVKTTLTPEDSTGGLTYTTSNPNVMTVSADGRITGVAPGAAILTVQTFNGCIATRNVAIYPEPTKVIALRDTITIGIGEQAALETWLEPVDARSVLTYSSNQKKNVTVDDEGTVTGLRAGTATITITAYNGVKDTVKVTVKKAPGSVTLSESELTLGYDRKNRMGETAKLTATLTNGSAGACEFTSSDAWVARVDPHTGVITARGTGTAVITATSYNGNSASCIVHVLEAAAGLEAQQSEVTLGIGQSCGFDAVRIGGVSRLTYASSDESVAVVNAAGTITARKAGQAIITAQTFNGCSASITVTVFDSPARIALAQKDATIGVGGQYQIVPVLPEGTMAGITYKSSKNAVATVDEDGIVTGVSPGTATITVKTHNGKQTSFTVTVIKAPTALTLNRTELLMQPTEIVALKPSLSKGSAANLVFSSSDESVAVVDGAGNVEAVSLGTCVITVSTNNGLSADCRVYVVTGPAAIRVPADMQIGTSELVRPAIEILNADGKVYIDEYTLTSSNNAVVSVSGNAITGKKKGTATITVRSHTITATFNVEVIKYASLYPMGIMAHRGASAYVQNNTLEAFRLAEEMGADGVELDVRRTKDGELVVFHDASLEVDGAKRLIADLTLEELRAIDLNGCTVPTLDEALDYLRTTDMTVQVELKEEGTGGECAEAVRRRDMGEQVWFISFYLPALNEVKYEDPNARIGYICRAVPTDIAKLAQAYDLYALLPRHAIVNEKLVNSVHAAGLKISTWTVNDAESIAQLSQMGVDFVATDMPDMALKSR